MPKILFIAAHRLDRSPSQRYRFEQYFPFLRLRGYECHLSSIISENDDQFFYGHGHLLRKMLILIKSVILRFRDWMNYNKYDIIFVQREALMIGSTFFERRIKNSHAKFVFDFDDSIWLMDTSDGNKKFEWLKNPEKTATNIRLADLVFAGNEYLASYARHANRNVQIIPTTIDTDIYRPDHSLRNNNPLIIGWSGSITTIKHFESAIPFLKILKEKYGDRIAFRVMGDPTYKNKELDIEGIKWTSASEVTVLNSFDIGIMPLPDDKWAKGKCGLKGLSYMALEIPTIMSPVGVNTEIIKHGVNGFLAATDDEWVQQISALIELPELRASIGKIARETVIRHYSVESQKENYIDAFQSLLKK